MAIRKKVILIICVVLLALTGSCADDKGPDTQNTAAETKMLTEPPEAAATTGENGLLSADETLYPVPTAAETPAPPEPMESPFIPDDENVSMPDPG